MKIANRLERRLGYIPAVLSGLGVTIGAGIFVLIAAGAGSAGNAVWLSFVSAAVAAAFTALSYARLIRFKPKNSPEYHYVGMAFNRGSGFLAGWLILWSIIVSASVVSLGFAGYLQHFLNMPAAAGDLCLIAVSTVIILMGIRQSMALLGFLTIVTILGLLAVIVVGTPYIGAVNLMETPQGLAGVWSAAALVFFAYLGFETMGNLADEMKNPGRDLPRAMLLVLVICALLYVMVAMAAVSAVGWETLSQSNAPVTEVVTSVAGSNAGVLITLVSLSATGSTVFFLLLSASRSLWAMSCAGVLPLPFCTISQRQTPWIAIIGVGVLAGIFVPIKNIETVALFTNVAVLLAFVAVNAAAIKLAGRMGTETKAKRLFYGRLLPGLGLVFSFGLAINTGIKALIFGGLLIIAGVLFYRVFGTRQHTGPKE